MINLEKKIWGFRVRVWGLVANMIGNIIALYGLSRVMDDGSGWSILVIGAMITLVCIGVCALPVKDNDR
ncbi:MAG: hypothetical protein COB36_10245 [Alphaproteobacteria bacterium]|nr:MAG: hypothetical protein COB36_10245 [Alphaproteobacteria bacterium]